MNLAQSIGISRTFTNRTMFPYEFPIVVMSTKTSTKHRFFASNIFTWITRKPFKWVSMSLKSSIMKLAESFVSGKFITEICATFSSIIRSYVGYFKWVAMTNKPLIMFRTKSFTITSSFTTENRAKIDWIVVFYMNRLTQYFKVRNSVISFVSILVMDYLTTFKFSAKELLHNVSMFVKTFSIYRYNTIPVVINKSFGWFHNHHYNSTNMYIQGVF